ncbi:MAG: heat-inducible transcription repressor HrcA [Chloroflexi bacterium]|nr:heat-inducible transcription repressor HrcA [Chloroflexota bacterium]
MDTTTANTKINQPVGLNSRRQTLLEIIVADYIETAVPVASQQLVKRYALHVSPATIRNDMAEIEELGYISRPHSSSGGIPADPGYRFYVERITNSSQLPDNFESKVRESIHPDTADPMMWAKSAAEVLSNAVANLAIATTIKPEIARVKQIQLVHLHDNDALLVVVMQEARVSQRMVHFDCIVDQVAMTDAANHLNSIISGSSATELRERWNDQINSSPLFDAVINETIHVLTDIQKSDTQILYTNGLRNLLNQPEFESSQKAQDAASVLEEHSLSKIFAESSTSSNVRVLIGEENQDESLRPFSVVYATYGTPGGNIGIIGTLGPKRMHYGKTIASVKYLSNFLNDLLLALENPK